MEAEKIRQETEHAKEDWEKVQIDKDKVQDSYKYYKKLAESEKGMYELYHSWCGDEKKSYEDHAGKNRELKAGAGITEELKAKDQMKWVGKLLRISSVELLRGVWYTVYVQQTTIRSFMECLYMKIVKINQHNFTDMNKANQLEIL